jgi:hypothetical protein
MYQNCRRRAKAFWNERGAAEPTSETGVGTWDLGLGTWDLVPRPKTQDPTYLDSHFAYETSNDAEVLPGHALLLAWHVTLHRGAFAGR